jgi:hypothetical protein
MLTRSIRSLIAPFILREGDELLLLLFNLKEGIANSSYNIVNIYNFYKRLLEKDREYKANST